MDYIQRLILEQYFINPDEYSKLEKIGGHSKYHLEGNALIHSLKVYYEARRFFHGNAIMLRAALLHDIGKIYTSIEVAPGDWIYPDHSICGSLKGILCKFIDLKDPHFTDYQWLIRNHIKPLFWREKGIEVEDIYSNVNEDICNLNNLRQLAICDLLGSEVVDKEASKELINWLRKLELK